MGVLWGDGFLRFWVMLLEVVLVVILIWCLEAGEIGSEEGEEEELLEGAGNFVIVVEVNDPVEWLLWDFDGVVSTRYFVILNVPWGFEEVATTWGILDVDIVDVVDVLGIVLVLKDGYFGWILWD